MVVVAIIFEIPTLPAYSAYIVFLLSRGEYVGTLLNVVGGVIAGTLSSESKFPGYRDSRLPPVGHKKGDLKDNDSGG